MLTQRKEEFLPDGKRIILPPRDLVQLWMKYSSFDPRYALGTATHETNCTTNERDTEADKLVNGVVIPGVITTGVYQVEVEEATHVGMHNANLLDPEECTIVFAKLTDERVTSILKAADWNGGGWPLGLNAYVYIAHNQGLTPCLKTVRTHGIDWEGYKTRNLAAARAVVVAAVGGDPVVLAKAQARLSWWLKAVAYGDDCLTGGPAWNVGLAQPLAVV